MCKEVEFISTKVGNERVTTNGEEQALHVGCVEREEFPIILR